MKFIHPIMSWELFVLCVIMFYAVSISAQNIVKPKNEPLKIVCDELGAVYYMIDNNALDFDQVDYSSLYETYLTPIDGQLYEDCTQLFIENKLQLAQAFYKTENYWNDRIFDGPADGVLGNDFRRIEVYFYPDEVKIDSMTYLVRGRTKVKKNICDFAGEIRIKKIYHVFERDEESPDCYVIIADYAFREDVRQKGSGVFRGIFGAYGYVTDDAPGIIKLDNRDKDGDGYMNRSYVGIWRSCENPALVKRCMWGDGSLPFKFDFDIGDGEFRINPKYASHEWDRLFQWKDLDIVEPESGDSRATYKKPWW